MIEIKNMDCLIEMKDMRDNAFDLAIVDPPYGLGNRICDGGMQKKPGRMSGAMYKGKQWDVVPEKIYFDELFRVSRNQIIWGGNYFQLPPTRGFIVWDKLQPLETYSFGEYAWTSFDRPAKKFQFMYTNYVEGCTSPEKRIHPTQKPVKLYEWIITNYATAGDKILDTHLGSGSIAIACHNLGGYRLTGYEIDKDYYEAAMKRLEEHKRQGRLFDAVSV